MIKKGLKVKVLSGRDKKKEGEVIEIDRPNNRAKVKDCLLYTSPSPRDRLLSRMPSSA